LAPHGKQRIRHDRPVTLPGPLPTTLEKVGRWRLEGIAQSRAGRVRGRNDPANPVHDPRQFLINRGPQVGKAVGVAVIGVILFSVLGSHAPTSARIEAANLSRQLAAQGVSAEQRRAVTDGFAVCFTDTSRKEDPAAVPASCRRAQQELTDPTVRTEVASAFDRARKGDFSVALAHAVRYAVAVFVSAAVHLLCLGSQTGRHWRHR
jgi:hypothetical protein